jgi:hypothetical protein
MTAAIAVAAALLAPAGDGSRTPDVSGLDVTPRSFARGTRTTISYSVSSGSRTRFAVKLRRPCFVVERGGPGTAPPRHCFTYVDAGSFTRTDRAGTHAFGWRGRLGGKRLPTGRYRLRVRGRNPAGPGRADVAGFRITRR